MIRLFYLYPRHHFLFCPRLIWKLILHGIILRLRPRKLAEAYREVWTERGSPLLFHTEDQCAALQQALGDKYGENLCVDFAMRYGEPSIGAVVDRMLNKGVRRLLVLPLYPQFSTTTTASSIKLWQEEAKRQGLTADTSTICCYPTQQDFIQSHAKLIAEAYKAAAQHGTPRVLFSAHGLPEKVVKDGDPYQWQCEETTRAVVNALQEIARSADRDSPDFAGGNH